MFSKKLLISFFLILIVGSIVVYFNWPTPNPPDPVVGPVDEDLDQMYREQILGTWQDEYKGKRTMIVSSDGTASMTVELSGLNAIMGSKMVFDEEWSIKGGYLKLVATGGKPKARVNLILKTMGNVSYLKILELTSERMHLLDSNGKTEYDWRRVE